MKKKKNKKAKKQGEKPGGKIKKNPRTEEKRKNTNQNPPGFFLFEVSRDHVPQIGEIKTLHQDKSETKLPAPRKHN